MSLSTIRIVLVEPAGPLNLGSVARVMKNFGLSQLFLVSPQCDRRSEEALLMAVHAHAILENAQVVNTIPEALQGCHFAIATIGREYSGQLPLESPTDALPSLFTASDQPVALIFGREDRGLSNEEINYAQKLIYIPTNPEYPSLNLATAVAICCYELSEIAQINLIENKPIPETAPAELREIYYQELETLLLNIGYLYPHTAARRMEKFRHLYNRANLQTKEVTMLLGILRQVEWAIKNAQNIELK